MKLSLIQLRGRDIEAHAETMRHILALTEQACQMQTDLILLPECAYPGYFIGQAADDGWRDGVSALTASLQALAKRYRKYIAAGLAFPEGERLFNSLLVWNREGALIHRADKSNLWHFDAKWFTPGVSFGTFETEFGTIGAMVCADGRIPEIARSLRLQGAKLILDSVNLVASAARPAELMNQQYSFILKTRARENGVYIAACNKCGVEDRTVTMLGRSFVATPDGSILAAAEPDEETILTCEVDLTRVPAELPAPRTPAAYGLLTAETQSLPLTQLLAKTPALRELEHFVAVVRFPAGDEAEYSAQAKKSVLICRGADAKLILLPPWRGALSTATQEQLCALLEEQVLVLPCLRDGAWRAVFLRRSGAFAERCEAAAPGGTPLPVPVFPGLRVNAVFGAEMLCPETARCQMLAGTDLVVWVDYDDTADYLPLLQTRAAENKLFVARVTGCEAPGVSLIANPDGGVVCTTFHTESQIAAGMVYTAQSRCKTVVPGTDILTSRIPGAYTALTT